MKRNVLKQCMPAETKDGLPVVVLFRKPWRYAGFQPVPAEGGQGVAVMVQGYLNKIYPDVIPLGRLYPVGTYRANLAREAEEREAYALRRKKREEELAQREEARRVRVQELADWLGVPASEVNIYGNRAVIPLTLLYSLKGGCPRGRNQTPPI